MPVTHPHPEQEFVTAQPTVAAVSGLKMEDSVRGFIHQTVLRFDSVDVAVDETDDYGSLELMTFPEGRINVLGAVQDMTVEGSGGIGATDTLNVAVGTAEASNTSLSSTMVDLIPADTNALVSGEKTVGNALAAGAQFDGTATAKKAYYNASDSGITEAGVVTLTGTITITWLFLGNY